MLTLYNNIEYFLVNYGYTLEMLLAISIFACHVERKSHFVIRAAGCYCVVLGIYTLIYQNLDMQNEWLKLLLYLCVNIAIYIALVICFHASGWVNLFILTGADAVQHISFRIYSVLVAFLGIRYEGVASGILNACVIGIAYFTIFQIFRKPLRDIAEHAYNGRSNIVLGVAVFAVSHLLYRVEDKYGFMWSDAELHFLFSAYSILAMGFLLALLYGVFQSRKMAEEMSMLENVIEQQKIQYELVKENIDNVNIKCHDMKQQISMFRNRIDKDALQEIKDIIHIYDTTFQTGNEVLDVFLQEKLLSCEREQIKLDCIVDGKCMDFIRPADLYTLVGNAIDNALEAVRKIENPEKRIITLSVREKSNMVLLHVDNEYTGKIEMKDDMPKSTKGDSLHHGFGMRSMSLIAEKYNGTLSIAVDDHMFSLNILIPIP